jgi:pyruvate dehydrogenase E1 component
LLEAVRDCCDPRGRPTYLRLTTRPVDQRLLAPALARLGMAELRRQVLAGGYRLVDAAADAPASYEASVNLVVAGALAPEACAAAAYLQREGVAANVINLTSARRLYEHWRQASGKGAASLARLFPEGQRAVPIVTLLDGASHTLAWLGGVYGAPVTALGVDDFGQSGRRAELYRHFGLDPLAIAEAAFAALDRLE